MDRLKALQVFAEVAKQGSFVKAADRMGLSKATVTKHISWLEATLGAQLLQRSSKHVSLTEAGWRALEGAKEMSARYESMEADVRGSNALPRGAIRIGSPPSFGASHLQGLLAQFTQRYPDVEVTLVHDDGSADLVAESLDLSIRIAARLHDASYVAQLLMRSPQVLVASPDYFRTARRPSKIEDLSRHNCLIHTIKSSAGVWRFTGQEVGEVKVRGSLRSNMGDALKRAALLGVGISLHPYYMVHDDIDRGALEIVLPDCKPEEMEIHVVFSTRRNMPSRVRHLLELLKAWGANPKAISKSASR